MNAKKLQEKLVELYRYRDVKVDTEFATELVPVIKLVYLNVEMINKIAKEELGPLNKLYVNHCDRKGKTTPRYAKIMKKAIEDTRYKLLEVIDALHDIISENSPTWNKKWEIKPYYKIKYTKLRSTRFLGYELKVKPEYKAKDKENSKIKQYNKKRRESCYKWRDSQLKFYKKVLKIIK